MLINLSLKINHFLANQHGWILCQGVLVLLGYAVFKNLSHKFESFEQIAIRSKADFFNFTINTILS